MGQDNYGKCLPYSIVDSQFWDFCYRTMLIVSISNHHFQEVRMLLWDMYDTGEGVRGWWTSFV